MAGPSVAPALRAPEPPGPSGVLRVRDAEAQAGDGARRGATRRPRSLALDAPIEFRRAAGGRLDAAGPVPALLVGRSRPGVRTIGRLPDAAQRGLPARTAIRRRACIESVPGLAGRRRLTGQSFRESCAIPTPVT